MPLPLVRLSSLDLIRGFVAVGRRMSITLAAEDLCLTQSAVSRQVHALEKRLGVQLLLRGYRSVSFTPEGERLFRSANGAVQQLQDVLGEIRVAGASRPVTLSASVGVTGLWLLPRLNRFQISHPGVDLRLSANNRISDLRNEGIDLAIRYAAETDVPAGSVRLFDESVAPVAHPSIDASAFRRSSKTLSKINLLEFDDTRHPWLRWKPWLAASGWRDAKPKAVLHFNQYDQVIHAALAAQGIALGRLELIRSMLEDGRLVRVATDRAATKTTHAYWLVRADVHPRADVRRVAAWISAEAGRSGS